MLFDKVNGASGSAQEYRLSADDSAALRVPTLRYEGGQVPVQVLKACLSEEAQLGVAAACNCSNGTMALSDVLQYLDGSSTKLGFGADNRSAVSNAMSVLLGMPHMVLSNTAQ